MKPHIKDFLKWGLPYAVLNNNIKDTAVFPIPRNEIGTDPAHYLLGTIWMLCTRADIKSAWQRHYSTQYTWEQFDELTKDWLPTSRATDCQGFNDAFYRYIWEGGDGTTDTSANGCYINWCGEKGLIEDRRNLKLGYAVFKGTDAKKTHIGYICGFDGDEPLVMEAQSFKAGVKVNYLKDRSVFKYYGVMDKMYDYSDYPVNPLPVELQKPALSGEGYRYLQLALNYLGYTDNSGNVLVVDGKCGAKTMAAYNKMVNFNRVAPIYTLTVTENDKQIIQEVWRGI